MAIGHATVEVTWTGNRKTRFAGVRYLPTVRFSEDPAFETGVDPGPTWDICIDFDPAAEQQGNPAHGVAYFTSINAPTHRLVAGQRFSLWEGTMKTAEAVIVEG